MLNYVKFNLIALIVYFALSVVNISVFAKEMIFFCKGYSVNQIDIRKDEEPYKTSKKASLYKWKISINTKTVSFYRNNEFHMRVPIAPDTGPMELQNGKIDFSFQSAYGDFYEFIYLQPPEKSLLLEIQPVTVAGTVNINFYSCE